MSASSLTVGTLNSMHQNVLSNTHSQTLVEPTSDVTIAKITAAQEEAASTQFPPNGIVTSDLVGDFVLFNRLPFELRARIWELTLPGPRILDVKLRPRFAKMLQVKNPVDVTTLRVCQESRFIALKQYSAILQVANQSGWQFRFDPTHDTIYFSDTDCDWSDKMAAFGFKTSWFAPCTLQTIQHIALTDVSLMTLGKSGKRSFFNHFATLKDITIVSHGDEPEYGDPEIENSCTGAAGGTLAFVGSVNHSYVAICYHMVRYQLESENRLARRSGGRGTKLNSVEIWPRVCTRDGELCCDSCLEHDITDWQEYLEYGFYEE